MKKKVTIFGTVGIIALVLLFILLGTNGLLSDKNIILNMFKPSFDLFGQIITNFTSSIHNNGNCEINYNFKTRQGKIELVTISGDSNAKYNIDTGKIKVEKNEKEALLDTNASFAYLTTSGDNAYKSELPTYIQEIMNFMQNIKNSNVLNKFNRILYSNLENSYFKIIKNSNGVNEYIFEMNQNDINAFLSSLTEDIKDDNELYNSLNSGYSLINRNSDKQTIDNFIEELQNSNLISYFKLSMFAKKPKLDELERAQLFIDIKGDKFAFEISGEKDKNILSSSNLVLINLNTKNTIASLSANDNYPFVGTFDVSLNVGNSSGDEVKEIINFKSADKRNIRETSFWDMDIDIGRSVPLKIKVIRKDNKPLNETKDIFIYALLGKNSLEITKNADYSEIHAKYLYKKVQKVLFVKVELINENDIKLKFTHDNYFANFDVPAIEDAKSISFDDLFNLLFAK